jgi:hypothetical protein
MDISPLLPEGSLQGIDHVTFGYPRRSTPDGAISFFDKMGIKPLVREEQRRIDDFLPGTRYDFIVGSTTITFAPAPTRSTLLVAVLRCLIRSRTHVAFRVSPTVFDQLMDHPSVDWSLGMDGKVRWGTGDWSLFITGPYGLRFEFRCPTAMHLDH